MPVTPGLVVEDRQTGFVGAAVAVEKSGGQHVVVLEDRHGVRRGFALGPGFWIEGRPVILDPPVARKRKPTGAVSAAGRRLTASGSYAVEGERAKVARASRIWVEGKHDAELVEKVWGDDLRHEGVVVLMLDGVDNLEEVMADFGPAPERRAGVLVDHLVAGSKESRIAQRVAEMPGGENVLVLGHPYVDVWQAVKPGGAGALAGHPAGHRHQARHPGGPGLAARHPGRYRPGLATHPGDGALLQGPRAKPAGPHGGAHRLRHRPGHALSPLPPNGGGKGLSWLRPETAHEGRAAQPSAASAWSARARRRD